MLPGNPTCGSKQKASPHKQAISIICMIIVIPQMGTFLSRCQMSFPSEDCRIYDLGHMWPILLVQSALCAIVVAIKIVMIKRSYHLYLLLHEYKSPLLNYITQGKYLKIEMPVEMQTTNQELHSNKKQG